MAYAGLVKRAKSHSENCNNGPEETPVQGDCSYILTPSQRPSPAGPECKKKRKKNLYMIYDHRKCAPTDVVLLHLT